jgi:hypothetical protein
MAREDNMKMKFFQGVRVWTSFINWFRIMNTVITSGYHKTQGSS